MNELYFPEFSNAFESILQDCRGKKTIVLGHVRPDGDCIGSQVALTRILRNAGIDAIACNGHRIPKPIRGFVGDTPFQEEADLSKHDFEKVITVDCSAIDRIGLDYSAIFKSVDLCIDHHVSNNGFAKVNWIDSSTAATAEILAGVAHDLNLDIDPVTAQALYIGLATDTGQFRYEATSVRVFELSAWLLKKGASAHEAAYELYERESANRIKLLQSYLATLEQHLDGKLAIGNITQQMFAETQTSREDTEGFIDYARSIEEVDVAVLLEEQPNGAVKGSLRANFPKFRVDQLAGIFGGGGHACAAGFHSEESLKDFVPQLIKTVSEHLKKVS